MSNDKQQEHLNKINMMSLVFFLHLIYQRQATKPTALYSISIEYNILLEIQSQSALPFSLVSVSLAIL